MNNKTFAFVFFLVCLGWGIASISHNIFPGNLLNPVIQELVAYTKGHDEETTTLLEKIRNDLNIAPDRQFAPPYFTEGRKYQPLNFPGKSARRESPQVYMAQDKMMPGYRLLTGTLDFSDHLHGALLLDPEGKVVRTWSFYLQEEKTKILKEKKLAKLKATGEKIRRFHLYNPQEKRFPHGLVVYPDGSLIFNDGDQSNGIHKIDRCSKPVWTKLGKHHHAISKDKNNNSVWTLLSSELIERDIETGKELNRIPRKSIVNKNPSFDFSQRLEMDTGKTMLDPWHPNDIEPLPETLAKAFPQFSVGDLLLSYRSLNLLFVLDPKTHEIKWWRIGVARRQHDPDWQPNGLITVFNNNMRFRNAPWDKANRFSSIISVDPKTNETVTIFSGKDENFYTLIRGKHQILPNGNIVLVSPQQGRALEVMPSGEVVFEYQNIFNKDRNLLISDIIWLPEDFFNFDVKEEC